MPRCSDDECFSMFRRDATDFFDCVRITKVDRDIALFYRRFDFVAKIALRDHVDLRIALRQVEAYLAHSSARSDQRNAHLSLLHRQATLTLPSPFKGRGKSK